MALQGPILVLVAHSGRTLQLDVTTTTQVALVQHALVSFTGVPVADQIAMYQGARLDPNKPLAAYGLPKDPATASVEDHPVFLYCRSYLKPGAALPPPEALPQIQVQVPPLAEVNLAHPLHAAASPMVRALPDYERHFTHHLATTRAYWDVAQARLARCRQLLSEQEVQARAADAARANVEAHYNYILAAYQAFLDKYNAQHAAHALLLSTFPADLAALEAMELHPSLQSPAPSQQAGQGRGGGSGGGAAATVPAGQAGEQPQQQPQQQQVVVAVVVQRRLGDLYPVARLREWADTCGRSHASFGAKVGELEALFQALRRDVEALFMQAPSVDLDALGRRMTECEGLLDEHSSMVQVLSKDLRTVRALVEDVVRQLGAAGGAGSSGAAAAAAGAGGGGGGGLKLGALHDAAAAMEAIHETHRNRVLPRLAALDSQLAEFAQAAEASKVAMSADVLGQLQRISGQQSRIRDMKNKLAAFNEVLGRQDAAFGELKAVHRLPAAYRALLAEVVRRGAWHQLYCGQAGRLAEHMTRFREKEAARRAAFGKEVARYLPTELLTRAGLAAEPPHCQVTVPPPAVPLIAVALTDLQRLSYLDERMAASSSLRAATSAAAAAAAAGGGGVGGGRPPHASHHHHHQQGHGQGRTGAGAGHHVQPHGSRSTAAGPGGAGAIPGTVAVLDADPPPPADPMQALEMENARLRAELANHIAAACVRELESLQQQQQPTTTPAAAAPARQQSTESAGAPAAVAAAGSAAAHLPQRVSSSGGGAAPAAPSSASGAASPAAAGSAPAARRDPAELVAAMQRAMAMKDDLIRQQQRESAALAARAAAYEERIAALEALLARQATSPETAAAALAAGGGGIGSGRSSAHEAAGHGAGGAVEVEAADAVDGSVAEDGVVVERAVSGPGPSPLPSGVEVVEVEAEAEAERARSGAAGQAELVAAEADALAAARGGDTSNSVELVEREEAAGAEGQEAVSEEAPQPAAGEDVAVAAAPVPAAPSPFALPAVQDAPQPEGPIAAAALAAAAAAASVGPSANASAAPSQAASRRASFDKSRALAAVAMEGRARTHSASVTDAASSVAAAIARHAALAPVRGSSGPQAIPGRGGGGSGGGNGGGGGGGGGPSGAGASPGGAGRYGSSCMPMAIGSLPFATSLPAASLLPGSVIPGGAGGRLDASPSGGIGLGLALGFGLGPLTEATDRRQRSGAGLAGGAAAGSGAVTAETAAARGGSEEDEEEDGAGAQSDRSSSLSGGSISASGSFRRAHSAAADEEDDERGRAAADAEGAQRAGGGAGGEDDDADSPVGGSSTSSSGLQFRPSWSGTPAVARASAPADGGEPGPGQAQGPDAVPAAAAVSDKAQEPAPMSLAVAMEEAAAQQGEGGAGESQAANAAAAEEEGEEEEADAAAASTAPGAHDAEGRDDDVDDAEAPDIDEVIDSGGGAWEVAAPLEAAMESAQEEGEEEERQAGDGGLVADAPHGAAAEQTSSGYETVGSV